MNENIDIRIQNYLTILTNPELRKIVDKEAFFAMQKAVAIYSSSTAANYIEEYKKSLNSKQDKSEEYRILS